MSDQDNQCTFVVLLLLRTGTMPMPDLLEAAALEQGLPQTESQKAQGEAWLKRIFAVRHR